MTLNIRIMDAESDCVNCGVHIHEGTTCTNASQVGGHYWDDEDGSVADPWTPEYGAAYNTTSVGTSISNFDLNSGFGLAENLGHAVVFHAQDGTRIGCGILEEYDESDASINSRPHFLIGCMAVYMLWMQK